MHAFKLIFRSILFILSGLALPGFSCEAAVPDARDAVVLSADGRLPLGNLSDMKIAVIELGRSEASDCFFDYCNRYVRARRIRIESESGIAPAAEKLKDCNLHLFVVSSAAGRAVKAFEKLYSPQSGIAVFMIPEKEMHLFAKTADIPDAVVVRGGGCRAGMLAAEAIFAGESICGRLATPVARIGGGSGGVDVSKTRLGYRLPEEVGFSGNLADSIAAVVSANIRAKSFPGCQVVVVKDGYVVHDGAYGHMSYAADASPVSRGTLYDIASMTKAVATAGGLMAAFDDGLFELDSMASAYLPRLKNTPWADVTVSDFLFHRTGLPPTLNTYALMVDSATFTPPLMKSRRRSPYTVRLERNLFLHSGARRRGDIFRRHKSPEFDAEVASGLYGGDAVKRIIDSAIYNVAPLSRDYRYSCLNFCMLKDMEENLTGQSHDRWTRERLFAPLGADRTVFNPVSDHHISPSGIAPTERDRFLRQQTLRGFVHDEIAAFSGGVQGNAGLFSTAGDIAKYCQMLLQGGSYGGVKIISDSTVRKFTETISSDMRGLGFDRAVRYRSMEQIGLPESAYGHLGFTGTAFWIDPDNGIAVIVMSNRVHPSRSNPSFARLNPRVAIMRAVYNCLRPGESFHEHEIDGADQ